MKTRAEAEMYAARARAALAEVGYGDHDVAVYRDPFQWAVIVAKSIPSDVSWQVGRVIGRSMPCLGCFSRGQFSSVVCLDPLSSDCGFGTAS